MRVFLAFDIPEEIKTQINKIITEKRKQISGIKWVERENLHITCKFLGEINNHQIEELKRFLEEKFNKQENIRITLRGFGAFPNFKRPRVLWIGVDGEKEKLVNVWKKVEEITKKLKIGEPERDYTPHLTVGRVKAQIELNPDFISFSSKEIIISTLTLYQSTLTNQGPIYSKLGEVKL